MDTISRTGNLRHLKTLIELDRFILMEHDLVRYAQNPKGISTENGEEEKAHKPRWSRPIWEQGRSDKDDCPHGYENHSHDRQHALQARRELQLVRQRFFQKVRPFQKSIQILEHTTTCMKS
jgi:hypothetical protein